MMMHPRGAILAMMLAGTVAAGCTREPSHAAHTRGTAREPSSQLAAELHPIIVRRPAGPPHVGTGVFDASGMEITIACSTCHASREPNFDNASGADLDLFHQGLTFRHGSITCLSCHNPGNYDALRLADGRRLEYPDVMTLCAQCHGPQARDYEHGIHGGMTGYWDRTKGPRTRNNCIDCHDPHAPQFPRMIPTFKPRDRFLTGEGGHE